jgi:hypothetical protein
MSTKIRAAIALIVALIAAPSFAADPARHWAFEPVAAVEPPGAGNAAWVRNPIDAFIAAGHKSLGLTPAPEATRRILARRLFLDLLGLPPSPAEIDAFVNDRAPNAYERLVERLLASPHYGERWGRHWLDLARWAESEGYESNHARPFAWRYRDWVVRAFNEDKPFAAFVREQIAGDEIVPYSDDNLIATGFLAACRISSNEEDKPRQRNDVLVDIVNATGSVFLGLTVGCAQCHDHKFDPIRLTDYYRLQAFFVMGQPGIFELKDPPSWAAFQAACPPEYDPVRRLQQTIFDTTKARLVAEARKALPPESLKALETPPNRRTPEQERLAHEADLKFQFSFGKVEKAIRPEDQKLYEELKKKLEALDKTMLPRPQTWAFYSPATSPTAVAHIPSTGFYPLPYEPKDLRQARVFTLLGGEVGRRGTAVEAGWPAVFGPTPDIVAAKGGRLALADWLTDARNPLARRVYVNRIWQYHFGRGIVGSSSNFGVHGDRPTHPELLDWLTAEFNRSGGSTKHLHRLIVGSATYRQASPIDENNARIDPENHAYWHWAPRRLEAEGLRDSLLAVSGELDVAIGGASHVDELTSKRRGLYLLQRRHDPQYLLRTFDGPDGVTESCPQRPESTTPLHALFLLNNPFARARADALARRVQGLAGDDAERQLDTLFLLTLGREPVAKERVAVLKFIDEERKKPAGIAKPRLILPTLCEVIINTSEFLRVP